MSASVLVSAALLTAVGAVNAVALAALLRNRQVQHDNLSATVLKFLLTTDIVTPIVEALHQTTLLVVAKPEVTEKKLRPFCLVVMLMGYNTQLVLVALLAATTYFSVNPGLSNAFGPREARFGKKLATSAFIFGIVRTAPHVTECCGFAYRLPGHFWQYDDDKIGNRISVLSDCGFTVFSMTVLLLFNALTFRKVKRTRQAVSAMSQVSMNRETTNNRNISTRGTTTTAVDCTANANADSAVASAAPAAGLPVISTSPLRVNNPTEKQSVVTLMTDLMSLNGRTVQQRLMCNFCLFDSCYIVGCLLWLYCATLETPSDAAANVLPQLPMLLIHSKCLAYPLFGKTLGRSMRELFTRDVRVGPK